MNFKVSSILLTVSCNPIIISFSCQKKFLLILFHILPRFPARIAEILQENAEKTRTLQSPLPKGRKVKFLLMELISSQFIVFNFFDIEMIPIEISSF